jgi:hypothetical protein
VFPSISSIADLFNAVRSGEFDGGAAAMDDMLDREQLTKVSENLYFLCVLLKNKHCILWSRLF